MKVKLTKIYRDQNLEGGLRTPAVEGEAVSFPDVGHNFRLFGAPLEGGIFRMIVTNLVREVSEKDGIYTFTTESGSVYTVEVL